MLKIKAYRSDDNEDGESICISMGDNVLQCCAKDVWKIRDSLLEAIAYACGAEVGDEPQNFDLEI